MDELSNRTASRESSIPAMLAPPVERRNPLFRSTAGIIGLVILGLVLLLCLPTMFWTLASVERVEVVEPGEVVTRTGSPRYDNQDRDARQLPPSWITASERGIDTAAGRLARLTHRRAMERIAVEREIPVEVLEAEGVEPTPAQLDAVRPFYLFGTDLLGRDVFIRCLAGGGISLTIGIAAAAISVFVGTLWGAVAAYAGGRVDAVMMRIVDILLGLPYILLVVLLAVAVDAAADNWQQGRIESAQERRDAFVERSLEAVPPDEQTEQLVQQYRVEALLIHGTGELRPWQLQTIGVVTLLVAIGSVSWLPMSRVVRGQVLSLRSQPFIESARAIGVPTRGIFIRHLLPNLVGAIVVYATLTVPQAILQESFLSFLGIGVRPPLPSWGNLAAEGLSELNPYKSNWWLLLFPCLLLAVTLLALNFVGEGLREAFDPRRRSR